MPERNAIKVGWTEVESVRGCTVRFCPGMGTPVILRVGKVWRPREGLVDGHEVVNLAANVKASSALIGVYDSMN